MEPRSSLPVPLRGIIPPLVTPLKDQETLDVGGLERLVEHVLAGGVNGLFILGTTGESPSLSYRLRFELIERVCRLVNLRVPVLAGIADTAFVESINVARKAADAGAQGLVLAPPYYFPAGQPELLEYLRHLLPRLPLPVFLYNMPTHTKLSFEPTTVREAASIPGIVGLKDSSANMIYFHCLQALFKDRPEFTLLIGAEELLAETVFLGGHGGVTGGANLFPRLYVDLYEAASRGDRARAEELHQKVMRVSMTIYSVGRHGSSYLKGLKCALACKGIIEEDFMAEPFHRFREPERRGIQRHLRDLEERFGLR